MQELEIVLFIYSPESLVPISIVAQSLNRKHLKSKDLDETFKCAMFKHADFLIFHRASSGRRFYRNNQSLMGG